MDKPTKMSQAKIYKAQNTNLFFFDMIVEIKFDASKIMIYLLINNKYLPFLEKYFSISNKKLVINLFPDERFS